MDAAEKMKESRYVINLCLELLGHGVKDTDSYRELLIKRLDDYIEASKEYWKDLEPIIIPWEDIKTDEK